MKKIGLLLLLFGSLNIALAGSDSTSITPNSNALSQPGLTTTFVQSNIPLNKINTWTVSTGWIKSGTASCPATASLVGGSCDMNRGGDGREISPRICAPSGNGIYCNEGNGGTCQAHAICTNNQ